MGVWIGMAAVALVLGVVVYDLVQKKHAILRNFPIIGHFRYLLEAVGPELRQYIVTNNDEERPFSRDQRRWVYACSKLENSYFGFGSDNEFERSANYLIVKHAALAVPEPDHGQPGYDPKYRIPCAKLLGGARSRRRAFRPSSIVNISAMSYGSLSGAALEALNRGAQLADCLHNTGEGGISEHHLHGGELVWQIGTGYFGCRTPDGGFSMEKLQRRVEENPQVRAIEIKLSQGAKPGLGGVLPAVKVSPEIAAIRGIPAGETCISPSTHRVFSDPDEMLDFVEGVAEATGLPVGIKSAVGEIEFWEELAKQMADTDRGIDFLTIDGGEGGTGAGPLAFTDHVALPFKLGFTRVYRVFAEHGLHEKVVFIGSGKLGFPVQALFAVALGCDMINVAREAMMAIGCIQAQRCHTGHCPTGVATQNRWLVRGLDPTLKSVRFANYVVSLRKEILSLCRACGVVHPALVTSHHFEVVDDRFGTRRVEEVFGYSDGFGLPSTEDRERVRALMAQGAGPVEHAEETLAGG